MLKRFVEWLTGLITVGESVNNFYKTFLLILFIGLLSGKDKYSITGVVQNLDGDGIKRVKLVLLDGDRNEIADGKSKKGGEFKFKKIERGTYILKGEHKEEGSGEIEVTVGNDNASISLVISTEIIQEVSLEKDSEEIMVDSTIESVILPQQQDGRSKTRLKFDETFYKYESNLKKIQVEIDSLKSVVKGYEKKQTMPDVSRELLESIQVPEFQHRIELQNGTVVLGDILEESDSTLILKTQIGKLVLKKRMVVRMDEYDKPGPKVIFLGEPFVDFYPDYQVFSGRIKNVGEKRADFVRIISHLWDQATSSAGLDSVFVRGTRIAYNSNVIADTALEPGQTATYLLTVTIKTGKTVQYHTMDIHWDETH